MEAVEIARQRAAALHDAAIASGANPWDPIDIVTAVAADKDLDIEPVEAGSSILAGGRAHFDPSDRAIRHEDAGDAFARAFLIGHELGHATLGDDRTEHITLEVDPARPAEAAPVGEDRVVDYSRRQRREVQMDLFGRELILPRARARSLHLGGMTASQIADRLGAPFDVVAMQLLDAMLLPEIDAATPQQPASPPRPDRHSGFPKGLKADSQAPVLRRGACDGDQAVRIERGAMVADCVAGSG